MSEKKRIDSFAERMKKYEASSSSTLVPRMPVVIRVDGKNFSKLTSGMKKPFDAGLLRCMQSAMVRLAMSVQNCKVAYQQSDEISLLLVDYQTLVTQPWFDNSLQKMTSIGASLATAGFAEEFMRVFPELAKDKQLPVFDCRCFNVPREDVTNYFIWRQRDALRNSISMAAQAVFSQKELNSLNRKDMIELLKLRKGIDWNAYETSFKQGTVCVKESVSVNGLTRNRWNVLDAPLFSVDRESIEVHLRIIEDEIR